MRKYIFLSGILIFLAVGSGILSASDLELSVKEVSYTDEGVQVSYTIKNGRKFIRPNIKIGFKVMVDDMTVACKLVKIDVPANASGNETMDLVIPAHCEGKSCKVASVLFGSSIKKYKIDEWMSGCPD